MMTRWPPVINANSQTTAAGHTKRGQQRLNDKLGSGSLGHLSPGLPDLSQGMARARPGAGCRQGSLVWSAGPG